MQLKNSRGDCIMKIIVIKMRQDEETVWMRKKNAHLQRKR